MALLAKEKSKHKTFVIQTKKDLAAKDVQIKALDDENDKLEKEVNENEEELAALKKELDEEEEEVEKLKKKSSKVEKV